VQRLASELQSTTVRAELLSAKGAMYDSLHTQAEQMRQDNQHLQVQYLVCVRVYVRVRTLLNV